MSWLGGNRERTVKDVTDKQRHFPSQRKNISLAPTKLYCLEAEPRIVARGREPLGERPGLPRRSGREGKLDACGECSRSAAVVGSTFDAALSAASSEVRVVDPHWDVVLGKLRVVAIGPVAAAVAHGTRSPRHTLVMFVAGMATPLTVRHSDLVSW